jgi:hypothetical protein
VRVEHLKAAVNWALFIAASLALAACVPGPAPQAMATPTATATFEPSATSAPPTSSPTPGPTPTLTPTVPLPQPRFSAAPTDRSFITDEPCAAPCWYGLVPGESTKSELDHVLAELPFVNQATVHEFPTEFANEPATEVYFQCHKRDEWCGSIIIHDGTVQEIMVSVRYKLTFGEVVEKLGPPDHVWASDWGAESTGYKIDLYYVQRGIIVGRLKTRADRYINWSDGSVMLAQEMQATSLSYFPPAPSLRDDFASLGKSPDEIEHLMKGIPPWPGWGESVPLW